MRTIVDLRGVNEAAETPHLVEGVECRIVGAHIEPGVGDKIRGAVADGTANPHLMMQFLTDHYRDYPRRCAPGFRTLFATLSDGTHRPLVFHCTAGKDRTGFASALLLTLLGVPWETVMEDYLRTNELWTGHIGRYPELDIDTRAAIIEARTPYLEAAFEVVRGDFGTPEDFAEKALGIGADLRERLKARFAGRVSSALRLFHGRYALRHSRTFQGRYPRAGVDRPRRAVAPLAATGRHRRRRHPGPPAPTRPFWPISWTTGVTVTTGSAARRRSTAGPTIWSISARSACISSGSPAPRSRTHRGPCRWWSTHGWPGSIVEFLHIIDVLAHPENHGGDPLDAFDVIVPSLPGYGFSGPPIREDGSTGPIGPRAIAGLWHKLVTEKLNYDRPYGVQGGDWGAVVSSWLAFDHPKQDDLGRARPASQHDGPAARHRPQDGQPQCRRAGLARRRWAVRWTTRPPTSASTRHGRRHWA